MTQKPKSMARAEPGFGGGALAAGVPTEEAGEGLMVPRDIDSAALGSRGCVRARRRSRATRTRYRNRRERCDRIGLSHWSRDWRWGLCTAKSELKQDETRSERNADGQRAFATPPAQQGSFASGLRPGWARLPAPPFQRSDS